MTDREWAQVFTVHRKWIWIVVKKQYRPERELTKEDLWQAACLGIWEHRSKFDESKGSITTWLFVYARHGIQMAYGRSRCNRNPILESDLEGQSTNERDTEWRPRDPYDFRATSEGRLFLTSAASVLSKQEQRVILLTLQDMGYTDAAKKMGVSRQYVEQVYKSALKKIQQSQQLAPVVPEKQVKLCLHCGKPLSWRSKKYCSHACHNRHMGYRMREVASCA